MRTVAALRNDIRFQWRHGFYGAYLFVCAMYVLLLHFVPEEYRARVAALLSFSDPSALGLLFAGGIILLERGQGIYDSLLTSPLRTAEFLLGKVASLAILSIGSAWVIHGFSAGVPAFPIRFIVGVGLTSVLFTLLGIGVAVRSRSLNGFIMMTQLYAIVLVLPLFMVFKVWDSPLLYLFPTMGSLLLMDAALRPVEIWEVGYSIMILCIGIALLWMWAYRSFELHIRQKLGGGVE